VVQASEPTEIPAQAEEVVPEPNETPAQIKDIPEPTTDSTGSEPSKPIEETPVKESEATVESAPAEEPTPQPKSDTVDIDFANQLS